MAVNREIVITGVGVVSPIGIGSKAFWDSLCKGRSGVRHLDLFPQGDLSDSFGADLAEFDPKQYVRPRKSLKVMSRDIQLGFAAADLACEQGGLHDQPIDPERLGIVFGADLIHCDLFEMVNAFRGCILNGEFDFARWGEQAMAEMHPLWLLKYLPNMPACHIGIAQDARGPNNSLTLGDVSSLCAVVEATRVIERGHADVMIAGGTGSRIHPAYWIRSKVFELSGRSDDPAGASRPFDARRDGTVNGEGAAAFLLETRQAIRGALRDAGMSPGDVGHVNANGSSTLLDDHIEAQAIRDTLADVPVTAPKSFFGNLGAGTGAVELAVSVLALQKGCVPPTLNYQVPDPQCPVNVIHGGSLEVDQPTALALNHTAYGQAVAMVLGAAP